MVRDRTSRNRGQLTLYGFFGSPMGMEGSGYERLTLSPDLTGKSWFEQLYLLRKDHPPAVTIPQALLDVWTEIIGQAVQWFHDPDFKLMPAMDYLDATTDSEVEQRIAGYQVGYDKEYNRRARSGLEVWHSFFDNSKLIGNLRYDFESMPMTLKRAVVSRWDEAHYVYLETHGLNYDPDEGYYWLIQDFKVKYLEIDKGQMPTEESAPKPTGATEDDIELWEEYARQWHAALIEGEVAPDGFLV